MFTANEGPMQSWVIIVFKIISSSPSMFKNLLKGEERGDLGRSPIRKSKVGPTAKGTDWSQSLRSACCQKSSSLVLLMAAVQVTRLVDFTGFLKISFWNYQPSAIHLLS